MSAEISSTSGKNKDLEWLLFIYYYVEAMAQLTPGMRRCVKAQALEFFCHYYFRQHR